ncbi:ATP-dependent DNA helicase RecQ [Bacillus sp. JCM 19034]|uniref:RecQ family ATP-dependent DNA helicase n=1 Tax=Bacillus sp. JCM 19034 TaxID=1481928 RepID=UPI0007853416|nr:ATP-dependent DNA helicase RecQ [Bacillus sp. JCM 19034]
MDYKIPLKKYFGYNHFRKGQEPIIKSLMAKRNVIAVLPTGTGKSICYQLPALLSEGLTIIVSPLLSLMEDQVQELRSIGIKKVVAINSFVKKEERIQTIKHLSQYKLVYLSPEMLQHRQLEKKLSQVNVSLFVVDEAHCISQWGQDFRPDYLRLGDIIKRLGNPPCLAITATATQQVQEDLMEKLSLNQVDRFIYSVDRPEIALSVEHLYSNDEKVKRVKELVHQLEGPGMIYCSSRKWTQILYDQLISDGSKHIAYYHGGLSTEDRLLIQEQFMREEIDLICCTSAFGMGINKKNIRYVIHFHMPIELEAYVQEIGRAARDQSPSVAIALYSEEDRGLAKNLLEKEFLSKEQLTIILKRLLSFEYVDDIPVETILLEADCSETAWRIILYHLEKFNIISHTKIVSFDLKDTVDNLLKLQENRVIAKRKKWREVETYVMNTSCRRAHLLRYFSEDYNQKKVNQCCDICKFDIVKYCRQYPDEISNELPITWQNHLKKSI